MPQECHTRSTTTPSRSAAGNRYHLRVFESAAGEPGPAALRSPDALVDRGRARAQAQAERTTLPALC
jgi:hypothetical protein